MRLLQVPSQGAVLRSRETQKAAALCSRPALLRLSPGQLHQLSRGRAPGTSTSDPGC